jgi:hypothetical protein
MDCKLLKSSYIAIDRKPPTQIEGLVAYWFLRGSSVGPGATCHAPMFQRFASKQL